MDASHRLRWHTVIRSRIGSFGSRVIGVGREVGLLFPIEDIQAYANLRAYNDFDADHRPEGRNIWLTLSFSPSPSKSSEVDKGQKSMK